MGQPHKEKQEKAVCQHDTIDCVRYFSCWDREFLSWENLRFTIWENLHLGKITFYVYCSKGAVYLTIIDSGYVARLVPLVGTTPIFGCSIRVMTALLGYIDLFLYYRRTDALFIF